MGQGDTDDDDGDDAIPTRSDGRRTPSSCTVCHTPLPITEELRLDDGDVQDSLTAPIWGAGNSFRPMNGRQAPPLRANTD